jgi:pyruvate,water dikinase
VSVDLLTPLAAAADPDQYGGKAAQLSAALNQGLPVPGGFALDWRAAQSVAEGETGALDCLRGAALPPGPWAVRSSAIGEDSGDASFAGAHLTALGQVGTEAVIASVCAVHASASEGAAMAYRERLGIDAAPHMGVVIQEMVGADMAGVLFTRNPVTGEAERVIEASWGLGEVVVSGLVTPDQYRVDTHGRLLERRPGEKDLALRLQPDGTVAEERVADELVESYCLDEEQLLRLHQLASACDAAFGSEEHDIEFAFARGTLFLLQRRPITHA